MYLVASRDGRVVHIARSTRGVGENSRYSDSPTTLCGALSYYSSTYLVTPEEESYPESIDDLCKTCREHKDAEGMLVELEYKEPPETVSYKVVVDVNIPKKSTIGDIKELYEGLRSTVEEFEGSDRAVEFNVKLRG